MQAGVFKTEKLTGKVQEVLSSAVQVHIKNIET